MKTKTKFGSELAVALCAAAVLPMAAMATVTVYVGGEGASDDNTGTSSKPYATIEKAMDRVNAEDNANDCKVYVRAGTYTVSTVKSFNKGDNISLIGETGNPEDVVIDGGGNSSIFTSTSSGWKSGLALRNVTIQNATGTAVYFQSDYAVVSNCVFKGNAARAFQTGHDAVIVDCVFKDNGDGTTEGGAVKATTATVIRNCSFYRNNGLYGAAVVGNNSVVSNSVFKNNTERAANAGSSTTIVDCVFEDNGVVSVEGGAVKASTDTVIRNCSFSRNRALIGGAVVGIAATSSINQGYQIGLDNCAFTNNFSATVGGAFCGLGGNGIVNCDFIGNVASNEYSTATGNNPSTGAVVARGGAVAFIGSARPANAHFVSNCTFTANVVYGECGSAVFTRNGDTVYSDCSFLNNIQHQSKVAVKGGAIARHFVTGTNHAATQTVERCVFKGNIADGPGAVFFTSAIFRDSLFVKNENTSSAGGAIQATSQFYAENCTFAENRAKTYGGAIAFPATGSGDASYNSVATNCLFVSNEAASYGTGTLAQGGVNVGWGVSSSWKNYVKSFYNCMEVVSQSQYDAGLDKSGTAATLSVGEGLTTYANKVVAGTLADFFTDAANGDYTTVKKSPARNVGVNHDWMASATDFARKPRINADDEAIVDIGCYEWYNLNPPGLVIIFK